MKPDDKLYNVKKVKQGKDDKKHYLDIGTLLIRGGGKTGVLFLNHLDGELAVFEREGKDARADATEPEDRTLSP